MIDPLAALTRAWCVTVIAALIFGTAVAVYPYWDAADYWLGFHQPWVDDF